MLNSVHSLYNENENIKKLNGFYRGTVLKHLPAGKCKVFIYGVYNENYLESPDNLPDAEQAAPLYGGCNNGNGVFSYPNIGSSVWCFFQNGDQNLPVIFASTLGGDIAKENYNIIKDNREKELDKKYSNVHRINSLYSNFSIFEEGIISASVETDKYYGEQTFTKLEGYIVRYDEKTKEKIEEEQGYYKKENGKKVKKSPENINKYSIYNNKVYTDYLSSTTTDIYDDLQTEYQEKQHIDCRHVITNDGQILSEAHNDNTRTYAIIKHDVKYKEKTINELEITNYIDDEDEAEEFPTNLINLKLADINNSSCPSLQMIQSKGVITNSNVMSITDPSNFHIIIENTDGSKVAYIEIKNGNEIIIQAQDHIKITAPTIDIESTTLNVKSNTINVKASSTSVDSNSMSVKSSSYANQTSDCSINGSSVAINGGGGDVVVSGKSLVGHTHIGNHGAPTSPPM